MVKTLIAPDAAPFFARTAPLQDRASGDRPRRPVALPRFATTAALPSAAAFAGGLAFNVALGVPVVSDGTWWYPITLGAHL